MPALPASIFLDRPGLYRNMTTHVFASSG